MRTLDYRSILVASDLTESCDPVIAAAARLAEAADAELHIVHVYELPTLPHHEERRHGTAYQRRIHELRRELNAQVERVLPGRAGLASGKVVCGTMPAEILNCAESLSADVIVLGPHRKRALGDRFLGGSAEAVVRTAEIPCLVVRGELLLPLRRVMVPIDLSEPARGALDMALDWSASSAAGDEEGGPVHLRVVHVHELEKDGGTGAGDDLHREVVDALERRGSPSDVQIHEQVIGGGEPAEEVLRLAASGRTDLLVLGTRGHGPLRRAWMGSVSTEIARRATCPVLLVPPALWRTPVETPSGAAVGELRTAAT